MYLQARWSGRTLSGPLMFGSKVILYAIVNDIFLFHSVTAVYEPPTFVLKERVGDITTEMSK